jgi:hypothetical protein
VVGCVGEEVGFGFVEEGGFAAVAFGEDDFVEEFDGRVVGALAFAFVDEFVEAWWVLAIARIRNVANSPCVCCRVARYCTFSAGWLFINSSILN